MNTVHTLSKTEINQLFVFVQKKRVRYKDVQVELVDHLASAIEDELSADNTIGFNSALEKVYKEFGVYGFAKIVQEKEKASRIMWRNRIWLYFKKFYQLPHLIGTLGASFLLFQFLRFFPEMLNYVIGITGTIGFLGLISICYFNYSHDNEIRDYLFIKSYMTLIGGLIYFFTFLPMQVLEFRLFDKLNAVDSVQKVVMSLFIPIACILCYILLFKIPREIISEIKLRKAMMAGVE